MKTDSRIGGGASALHYRHPLLSCISVFLECLADVVDPSVTRRVRWTPQAAATAAVLMSLDPGCSLQTRFEDARRCMGCDYRGRRRTGTSYNGLLKALERQQSAVIPVVREALRGQTRRRVGFLDPTQPWWLLAVDGSKEELPRTRDHETVFGVADNGAVPQALVTAIVEVHTGLLWDWRTGRARASEKNHLMEMIPDLPPDALLLGDGNFVGFPLWSRLHAYGKHFLIRVGGNVRLLRNLWPETRIRCTRDRVYVWPQKSRDAGAPLALRLIKIGSGDKAVFVLTNVLDTRRLSRKQAGTIYRKRWGAELFYRAFKRTMGFAKLQSRAGRRATIELQWALLASSIATLLGIDALRTSRRDPRRLSPAALMRTLRSALLTNRISRGQTLRRTLSACVKDHYQRRSSKQSRHRVVTKNTPKPLTLKPPVVRNATPQEIELAQKLWPKSAA